jgi:hypothetical protein
MNEGWDEKLEEGAQCKSWRGVTAIRACFWKFLQRTPRSSAARQPRWRETGLQHPGITKQLKSS